MAHLDFHRAPADRPQAECAMRRTHTRLRQVLQDVPFPAERWQLVAWADHYGADATTMRELRELPARRYLSVEHVLHRVADPARQMEPDPRVRV